MANLDRDRIRHAQLERAVHFGPAEMTKAIRLLATMLLGSALFFSAYAYSVLVTETVFGMRVVNRVMAFEWTLAIIAPVGVVAFGFALVRAPWLASLLVKQRQAELERIKRRETT